MAEVLISPGVLERENDQSFLTQLPTNVGQAIVGPTAKGKVGIPKIVTTYSDYLTNFGSTFASGSDTYTYFTSISAYNYFQNGGTSLLVTRVQSGSWSPAVSSVKSGSTEMFQLEFLSDGVIGNSTSSLNSDGTLPSGSAENIRWEITGINTGSGVFTVLVRRGNDSTQNKTILESFTNVSLDPNSPSYIERQIGNQIQTLKGIGTSDVYLQTTGSYKNASNYIRVSSVSVQTPDYLDNSGNPKPQFTASIANLAVSGAFGGGTGQCDVNPATFYDRINGTQTQGLVGANYTDTFNLLANRDDYRYNVITAPGLIYSDNDQGTALDVLISNVENRGDAIVVIDPEFYSSNTQAAVSTAATKNSSYTAMYWPWVQTTDPNTKKLVWVPASTMIPGVYAFNDKVGEPWFAPAGINRGGMGSVVQAERKLTNATRDTLYTGKVNPIATFPGVGIVVYGQKTLQTKASALDRVNVRRLLIETKTYLHQIALNLVFEQNTIATRNAFLAQANPYLTSIQQRQGLYAFKVVMDESNNTPDVIDRNQLKGAIYLQPTKTAEFIYLDFNITPTGASFPA